MFDMQMRMFDMQMRMLNVQMLQMMRFDMVLQMMIDQMVVQMMVEMVLDMVLGIVDDLVVDHLWFGELKDEHGGRQDHREKTQGGGLPGLEGDQSECERQKNGCLEFQTQQERDHDLFHESTS